MRQYKDKLCEVKFSYMQTIPVMLGYIFLGIAFGLLLQNAGYGVLWALGMSLFVYAGSMQFVLVPLITGGVSLIYVALITLFINGRHIFYGFSFIEKFKGYGWKYPYMIFALTDETYSLLCSLKVPENMDEKRVMFQISLFDQIHWVTGSVIGSVLGEFITFNSQGIDFAMTALFVVIVVNQWMENREHRPALIGLLVGMVCLLILGAEKFILPALLITAIILIGVKNKWSMQ